MMEKFFVPYSAIFSFSGNCVAVLAPHADDEILGCGGALISLTEQGIPVHVVVITDNVDDKKIDVTIRHQESCAAARIIGYREPAFWGLPDGFVHAYSKELVKKIVLWLTELQADVLLAPSCWEMHRDHRAVSEAAIAAVMQINGSVRLAMYEIGVPLQPNTLLDITPWWKQKKQAIACFPSQLAQQRYDLHINALNQYRTYTLDYKTLAAEAYLILSASELKALIQKQQPTRLSQSLHMAEKKQKELKLQQQTTLNHLQTLQEQLKVLESSKSWQLTEPLREIACFIRISLNYLSNGQPKLAEASVEAIKNGGWDSIRERMLSLRIYLEKLLKQ